MRRKSENKQGINYLLDSCIDPGHTSRAQDDVEKYSRRQGKLLGVCQKEEEEERKRAEEKTADE